MVVPSCHAHPHAQASKKESAAAKAAELGRMRAFKAQLDQQIAEERARREAAGAMSATERALNAKLLRSAEGGAGGGATIPAHRAA